MKSRHHKLLVTAATALMFASSLSYAHDTESLQTKANVRFVGDTQFSGFCKAIVENNVDTLIRQAAKVVGKIAPSRRGVMRMVTSEAGVTCNGKSLLQFSEEKNASDVHAFLIAQR